jgi:cytochrome c553
MKVRSLWIAFAVAHCALPLSWAVKPGETPPDLALRDRSGSEVRLSAYLHKKHVAVLARAPERPLPAAVLDDTCRRLDALNTVVLFLASDATENRRFLDNAPSATLFIDTDGVVRRVLPGQVLTGPELAAFVKLWQSGKIVFETSCARCHGAEGDLSTCEDVKRLAGIGRRLTEAEIRERLRMGEVNDRDVIIRGQIYSRLDVDAVVAYVAGL